MLQLLAQDQETFASASTYQNAETSTKAVRNKPLARLSARKPPSPPDDAFQNIRTALHDVVSKTATQAALLSQAMVKQALELGQMFWQMQRDLKSKEYKAFLSVLGWASAKVRKYINLAKTFDGFELDQLIHVELTTLLSLCTSRYSSVVAHLREVQEITQQTVEQLLAETRSPRKLKQDPISGWKQNRSGGGRRYEVILHDESTGLSIEQQALAERILPQRVIAEAIALRAEQKSSPVQADEQISEEYQIVTTPDAQSAPCMGDLPQKVTETQEVLPVGIPTSLVEKDTQELETPIPEFQVGDSEALPRLGDRAKIVSVRKGAEFDGQIGIVKTVSVVGCVIECLGKTVWFAIDELVLAAEETRILAEPETAQQFATDFQHLNNASESAPHLIESNADFIDDINQEADSRPFNSLEVW